MRKLNSNAKNDTSTARTLLGHGGRRLSALLLTGALCLLAACSGQNGGSTESSSAAESSKADAESSSAAESGGGGTGAGSAGTNSAGTGGQEEGTAQGISQDNAREALPEIGDTLHGFQVEGKQELPALGGTMYEMKHQHSGTDLVYIHNEDPELAFAILFRVPQLDEADTAHVFEHSITASSDKYESKDIFFDLAGKSYNTFINAYTTQAFTCYPVASQSQDQLEKMADVYMSCMAAPSVLENENFFKREALRYVLYDAEDPISFDGIVYAEDRGRLTDLSSNSFENIQKALYPDMAASKQIGQIDRHYADVSYQHQLDTYEQFYHFDNALILLYGDMDHGRMLAFLDENYLGLAEETEADGSGNGSSRHAAEALSYFREDVPEGFVEAEVPVPAYTGDDVVSASNIDYCIDLSAFSEDELFTLDFFLSILDMDSSVYHTSLWEKGIYNQAGVGLNLYDGSLKNNCLFRLSQAEPSQKDAFREVVEASLQEIAETAFPEEMLQSFLKRYELNDYLALNDTNIGVKLTSSIGGYWAQTEKMDILAKSDETFLKLKEDPEGAQEAFKSLAEKLLAAPRQALVVSTPSAGLAEEIEAAEDAYLADVKASMSAEELDQLIQDTLAFDSWNGSELANNDFMIPLSSLPDPASMPEVQSAEQDGITQLSVPTDIQKAGSYGLLLDSSGLSDEELNDLALYMLLAGEVSTEKYERAELDILQSTLLSGFGIAGIYPEEGSKYHYPIVHVSWEALTEDYADSLDLVLEILSHTDFGNTEEVSNIIEMYGEDYNPTKADGSDTAYEIALAYSNTNAAYQYRLTDTGFYSYLYKELDKLKRNPAYGEEFAGRMQSVADRLLQRGRLVCTTAAAEEAIPAIQEANLAALSGLPEGKSGNADYLNPYLDARNVAVYLDASLQNSYFIARMRRGERFQGNYIPFLAALYSNYLTPELRFKGGAYSAGAGANVQSDYISAYSASDPNVSKTLQIFREMPDALRDMQISEEDLEGYILKAYGDATYPSGILDQSNRAMMNLLLGKDEGAMRKMVLSIKDCKLADQEDAANAIEELLSEGTIVMAGNAAKMQDEADAFDIVYDYRQ